MTQDRKKLFYIAVTDIEGSDNRKYSDTILEMLKNSTRINRIYNIEAHYTLEGVSNLDESLEISLYGENYDGYIVLLDCLDKSINSNVMFELGAIKALKKPYAILSQEQEHLPFDIKSLNCGKISDSMITIIKENIEKESYEIYDLLLKNDDMKQKINVLIRDLVTKLSDHINVPDEKISLGIIHNQLLEIKKGIINSAEYIEGEDAAFSALTTAIIHAKHSLRTSRFANQSIVCSTKKNQHKEFMRALYEVSGREGVKGHFDRIICNNNPNKWSDIRDILLYGSNDCRVYVRKANYSIHFELVIIDEEIAFIHFYQSDGDGQVGSDKYKIETINSTLKVKGTVCKNLTKIFDRLHHRDVNTNKMINPSRTLLGIPNKDMLNDNEKIRGCFCAKDIIPKDKENDYNAGIYETANIDRRKNRLLQNFKKAFREWEITDENDKINMAVGIALLEQKQDFIDIMKQEGFLPDDLYKEAVTLYNQMKEKD